MSARGLIWGVGLGIPLWIGIIYAGHTLLTALGYR